MKADLDELRRELGSIRSILQLEGRGPWPCVLHEDRRPSFSVFERDGVERWRCHAGCGSGDRIDLEAMLRGTTPEEIIRSWRSGSDSAPRRKPPPKKSKPKPHPRPDPSTQQAVSALWLQAVDFSRNLDGSDEGFRYLAQRLGSVALARQALGREIAAVLPSASRWRGRPIGPLHRLAVPLWWMPPAELAATAQELGRPVGIQRRAVSQTSERMRPLFDAGRGLVRVFGRPGLALAESDGGDLRIVEGLLSFVAVRLVRGDGVLGLDGAGSARRVAERITGEVAHLRRCGIGGPARLLIDTDRDRAGDQAAEHLAAAAKHLGIAAARADRRGRVAA